MRIAIGGMMMVAPIGALGQMAGVPLAVSLSSIAVTAIGAVLFVLGASE